MQECPMAERVPKPIPDPAYVWFPNGWVALRYCKQVSHGRPCQFCIGEECSILGYLLPIKNMRYCPARRYNPETMRYYPIHENYDILRNETELY